MAFQMPGAGALDYAPCHYGVSKLVFRGPARSVAGRYVAVLGSTETFGKYVAQPFAEHLEIALGLPVVNLGVANAGPEVFLADEEVGRLAENAGAVVVQIMGAQNQSNCFYSVHPRRNDRVLGVTTDLRALFPEVDFTEFHFTRHLLQSLSAVSRERFGLIVAALQERWTTQMMALMARLGPKTVLLWTGTQAPLADASAQIGPRYPAFVDRSMVTCVAQRAARFIELSPPVERPSPDDLMHNLAVEAGMPGPRAHRSIAERLLPVLRDLGI
jgi:Domain of unknown function (DUF6473)